MQPHLPCVLFGFAAVFSGLIGYSLHLPRDFGYRENDLKTLAVFYTIVTASFLFHAIGHVLNMHEDLVHAVIALAVVLATFYLFLRTGSRVDFSAPRFRDAVVYGAVVWLIGREMDDIFHDSLSYYEPTPLIIAGVTSFPLTFVIFYVLFNVNRKNTGFFLEGGKEILSNSYLVVYLMGIGVLGACFNSNVHYLSVLVATSVVIYVFAKIYITAKPFLD
ncbi:hypothetical protein [Archaeoglobus veneficus]|uniref:Uncharacterized protein n=1 Tax=Archaeoglobus veneficus (strain DSM 11195 / SNP6) TaxID=693661 RepID=F2KPI0_ARCVS|nr:hypothetical protein [Archaeoglobus veneficus]AEA46411.1 hypothetical protein Arcve_0378 [Archaeoglobus veneficus SNP6]